jgi:hypothetical protein
MRQVEHLADDDERDDADRHVDQEDPAPAGDPAEGRSAAARDLNPEPAD